MTATVLQQTEAQFQAAVIEFARLRGWRVAHFHDSRRQVGGRLVGDADAAGFPDLTMVRFPRLLFAELKAETGRVTPMQQEWLNDLCAVGREHAAVEVHVWRPRDWSTVEAALA